MSVPLTIETFEFEKLRAKAPELKTGGEHNYYSIPFDYKENKALIRIHGNFRVFKHKKNASYSLGIRVDDDNEEFFESLGERIAKLSCNFRGYPKLKLKPSDLELIKPNSDGKYRNVYAKIYTNNVGKVKIPVSETIKVDGKFQRKRIDIDELVDESFKGTCVIRVYRVYVGLSKTITISVEEILATEIEHRSSYFDEYEEIESSDED